MGVESCWNKQAGVCCCKSEKGCVAYKAPPHVLSWADSRDIQSHNSTMPGGMICLQNLSSTLDILQSLHSIIIALKEKEVRWNSSVVQLKLLMSY